MKGKVARNLRKLIERSFNGLPEKAYEEQEHTSKMVQVGFYADGTPQYQVVTPKTTILASQSQRKLYQQAKQAHKQAVQAL